MQALHLLAYQLKPNDGYKRGKDLEDNRLQVGQPGYKLFRDRVERIRDSTGMRVQPEAVPLHASGKVDLPNALEWQLMQILVQRLPAVHAVAVDIVQVQQEPAVGAFDHAADKISVGQLIREGPQVAHSGLNRDRYRQRRLQHPDRGRRCLKSLECLARWQEEAGGELGGLVEAQVVARPGRAEVVNGFPQPFELGAFRPHRPADVRSYAWDDLASGKPGEVLEHFPVYTIGFRRAWNFDPGRLRLDLQYRKKFGMLLEQGLDGRRVNNADPERRQLSQDHRSALRSVARPAPLSRSRGGRGCRTRSSTACNRACLRPQPRPSSGLRCRYSLCPGW